MAQYDWSPYWLDIWYAAEEKRKDRYVLSMATTFGGVGVGMFIGTAILPIVGTIIGAGISLILFGSIVLINQQRHSNDNYTKILLMNRTEGLAYARRLYWHHGKFFNHQQLLSVMCKSWPELS